jgi:hypothetical protein
MPDDPFEQRRSERRDAMNLLDYEIVSAEGETIGRGVACTLNVSTTGLLLETGQFFEVGQFLRITLELKEELIQLTGRVAHSQPIDDNLCSTGVQFVEFAEAERRLFQIYFEGLKPPTA